VERVEASFVARLEGHPDRGVPFRADRVDRPAPERLVLTDYKTSAPWSWRESEAARMLDLLGHVERGENLQAAAYASIGSKAVGRYLFLRPEGEPPSRSLSAAGDDGRFRQAFEQAVVRLWEGWDEGAFFPRFVDPDGTKEPRLCRFCEVSEACLRGESTARLRFLRWLNARETDLGSETVRSVFLLGRTLDEATREDRRG
jgi:hypothetical protein